MVRYDRIWELSKLRGKTKSYLSLAMGHPTTRYLLDAKKQNTNIKLDELEILAAELGTTVSYLTGDTDEKSPPTLNEQGEESLPPDVQTMIDDLRTMGRTGQLDQEGIAFLRSGLALLKERYAQKQE